MGNPEGTRSFLEQLADYDDPTPKDFDPEDDAEKHEEDTDLSDEEGIAMDEAREHYTEIGKSTLRQPDGINLGPQYRDTKIGRDVLDKDHAAWGKDEDSFSSSSGDVELMGRKSEEGEDEAIEASGSDEDNGINDEENEVGDHVIPESLPSSLDDDEGLDAMDKEDSGLESDNSPPPPAQEDRAALRKMMADEQKSVAVSLSTAAKKDIAKGRAIKQQRSTFDSLLNARIKLQKALISTNSMSLVSKTSISSPTDAAAECVLASRAAEEAALTLLNSLSSLRNSLFSVKDHKKGQAPAATEASSQSLWDQVSYLDAEARLRRRAAITKWSLRTNPVSAIRPQNRFSQAPPLRPLTSVLDQQLSGESMERAIKRTRTARSCAPIQAASKTIVEDEKVYDDADFYTLLLRELVDRRMVDTKSSSVAPVPSITNVLPSRAELKVKKQVDTKASKGRKMRYTVHEKLQNFMAADDRGSWGERQRAELFGSLLGTKIDMGEKNGEDVDMQDDNNDVDMEAGGLKLFGR